MRSIITPIAFLLIGTSTAADCSFGSLEEGPNWKTPFVANGVPLNVDTLFVGYYPDQITEEQRTDLLIPRARGTLRRFLQEAELGVRITDSDNGEFSVLELLSNFDASCDAGSIVSIPIAKQ